MFYCIKLGFYGEGITLIFKTNTQTHKAVIVGTRKNHLNEAVLKRIHNL